MSGRGHQLIHSDALSAELEALGLDSSLFGAAGIPAPIYQAVVPRRAGVWDVAANTFGTENEPTTYGRASNGMYRDSAGQWQVAAAGVPRPHYAADGSFLGILFEPAATNLFLNSDAPATQSIALSTGEHTISVYGTGSVTSSNGSGTATGHGAASDGSPVTINVTGSGTVNFTVAGSPDYAQVEATSFATTPIIAAGVSASRLIDAHACAQPPSLAASPFSIAAWFTPLCDGADIPAGRHNILSLEVESNPASFSNRLLYYARGSGTDSFYFRKSLGSVFDTTASPMLAGVPIRVIGRASATNIDISFFESGAWKHNTRVVGGSLVSDNILRIANSPYIPCAIRQVMVFNRYFTDAQVEKLFG